MALADYPTKPFVLWINYGTSGWAFSEWDTEEQMIAVKREHRTRLYDYGRWETCTKLVEGES